jgi:hypothetical protein
MDIDLHPEADLEFIEASQRYESRVPGLGARFIDEFERLKNLLRERPEIGVRITKTFRRAVFRTFPFSLIYSIEGPVIWVIAVAHQSRRPGYWRKRQ